MVLRGEDDGLVAALYQCLRDGNIGVQITERPQRREYKPAQGSTTSYLVSTSFSAAPSCIHCFNDGNASIASM